MNWSELFALWNGKTADLDPERAFWFRTLRWFFASFLLFTVITYGGLYHLMSIAHP